jgi:hypothetical protein
MNSLDPQHPPSSAGGSRGWLITLTALLDTILVPLCVGLAMAAYDAFDPMCRAGGEGGISCGMRAFVTTMMSIVPGFLIGVVAGVKLAGWRHRKR